jgi:hypothetical protein
MTELNRQTLTSTFDFSSNIITTLCDESSKKLIVDIDALSLLIETSLEQQKFKLIFYTESLGMVAGQDPRKPETDAIIAKKMGVHIANTEKILQSLIDPKMEINTEKTTAEIVTTLNALGYEKLAKIATNKLAL